MKTPTNNPLFYGGLRMKMFQVSNRMDGESSFALSPSTLALTLLVVGLCVYAAYTFYYGRATVPSPSYYSGFEDKASGPEASKGPSPEASKGPEQDKKEGFFGGVARGAGSPDCLRTSSEGSQLIALFSNRPSSFEEGSDDLRELTQLVGKLSCFKKDLVSPSYIVDATRSQQFVTMHDIEPIAETTGRCFAKTVSPRDLELAFDKWTNRGELLIRRLCTSYRLSEKEVIMTQTLFQTFIRDVKDIARGACLQGEPMIAGKPGPRDPHPYEKPSDLGDYTGYY